MHSRNRDRLVTEARAKPGQIAYGGGIGILLLEDIYPGFPGDLRNASAWGFPIQYEMVPNLDIYRLVEEPGKNLDTYIAPIVEAALRLQNRYGCRAIAAECGFFAYFQKHVAAALDVPVFMSSLLQINWIQSIIGPDKLVGVYTSSLDQLSDAHLEAVGTTSGTNYRLFDFYDCVKSTDNPETNKLWNTAGLRPDVPGADYGLLEAQLVEAALEMVRREPKLGAILLECTGYQPFGRAIQVATGLPTFSWSTLLDFAWSATNHRDFYGHV